MTDETHDTVAAAEKVITDAGYVRDAENHVWVQPGTKNTAKVVRTGGENNFRFFVKWG